jgi:hypothetical protein
MESINDGCGRPHTPAPQVEARIDGMRAEINGLVEQLPAIFTPSQRSQLALFRKQFLASIDEVREEEDEGVRTLLQTQLENAHARYTRALMRVAGIPFQQDIEPLHV